MKWNKAYTDVDKMEQALKDGGINIDGKEKWRWQPVLVARCFEGKSYQLFVANYFVSIDGIGLWSSELFMDTLFDNEHHVRDTDMWTVIEMPEEDEI